MGAPSARRTHFLSSPAGLFELYYRLLVLTQLECGAAEKPARRLSKRTSRPPSGQRSLNNMLLSHFYIYSFLCNSF